MAAPAATTRIPMALPKSDRAMQITNAAAGAAQKAKLMKCSVSRTRESDNEAARLSDGLPFKAASARLQEEWVTTKYPLDEMNAAIVTA